LNILIIFWIILCKDRILDWKKIDEEIIDKEREDVAREDVEKIDEEIIDETKPLLNGNL
jgi:hypothetical protein